MSLCHKTSHLYPDVYRPPPSCRPMPQCVWEGEGDLTTAGQKRGPNGAYRREVFPNGFRCGQGTPDIGRGNLLPWVSLGSCNRCSLFGGLFLVVVFVVAEVLKHQKWMVVCVCVFFVWWERGWGISDVAKILPNGEK